MEKINNSEMKNSSEKIISDIDKYLKKNTKIITKEIEIKIPHILKVLKDKEETLENKKKILDFIKNLFEQIPFNMEIINNISLNDSFSLYKIFFKEYFNSEDLKYKKQIKSILKLMIRNINYNNEDYEYLFSLILFYINIKNNNLKEEYENEKLTPSKFNNFLNLLSLFYKLKSDLEEIKNYFYFSGNTDSKIRIDNKNNILNFDSVLNILIFFQLKLNPEETRQIFQINFTKLINIKLSNGKNISLNIDMENILTCSFSNDTLFQFKKNEINSCLIKLKNNNKILEIEIYINEKKIEYNLDNEISLNEKKMVEIEYISFFNFFTGICSSIIIYKNDIENNYLKIFENKEDNIYKYGIYKEELLEKFHKQYFSTYSNKPLTEEKKENEEIINLFYLDLISIYIPTRYEIDKYNENKIMLIDSINNLNGELIIENTQSIGIHIFDKKILNLSSINNINSLLPILEIMTENNEILSQENLNKFFLILNIFYSDNKYNILDQNNSEFFTLLSLFLEKIPNEFFDDETKSLFITLSNSILILLEEFNEIILISNQYHREIFLNKNILKKFSYKNQKLILKHIFTIKKSNNNSLKIKSIDLISLLLLYDKEFKYYFCCKEHSFYFLNNENIKIRNLEVNEVLDEVFNLINLIYIEDFQKDLIDIYKLLIKAISPCMQNFIIKLFSNFLSYSKRENNLESFNELNSQNIILDISLYSLQNSLLDVRINLFVFIIEILDTFENNNVFLFDILNIKEIKIFIENNIIK